MRYLIEVTTEAYDSDDEGEEVIFAKARCFLADLEGAMDELGGGPDYVLEMESATAAFIEPLFVPGRLEFREAIVKLLRDDPMGFNIFILDRLEILPGFRGKGLSKRILNEMIRHFSANASLVALKAFPLQLEAKNPGHSPTDWETSMRLENLPSDPASATQKLKDLYSELKFQDTGVGGIMVRLP